MTPVTPVSHAPFVIAMDGTSGSGKSSTARGAATRLSLRYLDTGAQFRAVTLWMLERSVDPSDAEAVAQRAEDAVSAVRSGTDPAGPTIQLDGVDVSAEIRSDRVNGAVSAVSVVPAVREGLLDLQREIIIGGETGIVVEGRDIGSVVWPEAGLKVYLTADPEARASRRYAESRAGDLASTRASLLKRDQIDSSRPTAPLCQVDGAVQLDTTHITLDQAIDAVVGLARGDLPDGGLDRGPVA